MEKRAAPYPPYPTFKGFIADLRAHGVPPKLDNSVFGNAMSGAYRGRLKQALRFLGLADEEDTPTDSLRALVAASANEKNWQKALWETLANGYPELMGDHPLDTTTPVQLRAAFNKNYVGEAETQKKAMTFFLQAAREAGVPLSKRLDVRQRSTAGSTQKRRSGAASRSAKRQDAASTPEHNRGGAGTRTADPAKPRKIHDHQMALIEIINTYTDMKPEMRTALLEAVGFIALKGGAS